ncbi:MAG: hypothetical protein AAF211_11540 [Myxococcota bacterium]
MVQTHENQEEIERSLEDLRRRLRQFEERVDYRRLILRLRTASPAHPVLLARSMFAVLAVLAALAGLAVLLVPFASPELARELAKVESVIPYVPQDVPALPAVCGVLAFCMVVAWAMSTGAALAIGRESKLLPWEQKQHQSMVNEITRLTAVQRIRSNTPAQARPRIATPAPASMRSLSPVPMRTPSPARGGGTASAAEAGFGFRRTPTPAYGVSRPSPKPTGFPPSAPPPAASGPPSGGRGYPYSQFGSSPQSVSPVSSPPAPRPGAVPARPPTRGTVDPEPIVAPPPAPLSATPRMGAPDVPDFDESALDDDPMIGLADESVAENSFLEAFAPADDTGDLTSPDLHVDPPHKQWEVPPSRQATTGLDGSFDSSIVPLLDLDDDLAGPDDIEIESVAEVEMIESSSIHSARGPEPSLPMVEVDPETGPIPPSDGPVVYDPAAVRESELRESPAQPQQVRRPDSPSDATTVRGVPVVDPSLPIAEPPETSSELLDLPDAGPRHEPEPEEDNGPVTLDTLTDENPDDDVTVITGPPVEDGIAQQGILARARQGAWASRATPFASAGRLRPSGAPARAPRNTRGGTPLGAPPQETGRRAAASRATPPSLPGPSARDEQARKLAALSRLEPTETEPDEDFEDDAVTVLGSHVAGTPEEQEQRWVSLIVAKAQSLSRHLPAQAQMAFSQEPHLPFTLVIARATPTVAVRAMMSFVEFLANIPTPPRARIELVQVSHLDRSFHRNVQAALEPHFDRNVVVEHNAGRVDIQFTDPDPRWGRHPHLPA